jgi:hypothetical protein
LWLWFDLDPSSWFGHCKRTDVSDIFQSVRRNLPFVNETNCVSAFYSASNSLS